MTTQWQSCFRMHIALLCFFYGATRTCHQCLGLGQAELLTPVFFLLIPLCWERLCEQEVGIIKWAVECPVFVRPSPLWTLFCWGNFKSRHKHRRFEKNRLMFCCCLPRCPPLSTAVFLFCSLPLPLSHIHTLRSSQCLWLIVFTISNVKHLVSLSSHKMWHQPVKEC